MKFKGFLVKHNRIFIPVISIIPSALIFYMSVYIPELIILIFAIPVIIFLLMHFLNIHTFKPRLFGGFAILLIVLLISSGFYTNSLYLSGGVSHNTVNGTYMETSISPFTEYSGEYNITSLTNYTGSLKNANITIISSTHSKMVFIMVDSSKFSEELHKFPLPVEVLPFMEEKTKLNIEKLGCKATFRDNKNFKSDNGNYILDCKFDYTSTDLEEKIKMIPGVVEVGIFKNITTRIFEGRNGECHIRNIKKL